MLYFYLFFIFLEKCRVGRKYTPVFEIGGTMPNLPKPVLRQSIVTHYQTVFTSNKMFTAPIDTFYEP